MIPNLTSTRPLKSQLPAALHATFERLLRYEQQLGTLPGRFGRLEDGGVELVYEDNADNQKTLQGAVERVKDLLDPSKDMMVPYTLLDQTTWDLMNKSAKNRPSKSAPKAAPAAQAKAPEPAPQPAAQRQGSPVNDNESAA